MASNDSPSGLQPAANSQQVRRSNRVRKPPAWLDDFVTKAGSSNPPTVDQVDTALGLTVSSIQLNDSSKAFLASIENVSDPVTLYEAVKEPKWCQAMDVELRALEENGTWTVTSLPPGKKAIGCKWTYRTKFKSDGNIDKCKARLVALDCRQKFGVDYWETFAPVAKMTTVRTLLAVASSQTMAFVSNGYLQCFPPWRPS